MLVSGRCNQKGGAKIVVVVAVACGEPARQLHSIVFGGAVSATAPAIAAQHASVACFSSISHCPVTAPAAVFWRVPSSKLTLIPLCHNDPCLKVCNRTANPLCTAHFVCLRARSSDLFTTDCKKKRYFALTCLTICYLIGRQVAQDCSQA